MPAAQVPNTLTAVAVHSRRKSATGGPRMPMRRAIQPAESTVLPRRGWRYGAVGSQAPSTVRDDGDRHGRPPEPGPGWRLAGGARLGSWYLEPASGTRYLAVLERCGL